MASFRSFSILILLNLALLVYNENTSSKSPQSNASNITVGKIFSTNTQIPYAFYEAGYCKIPNTKTSQIPDTIGELFTGDSYADSPFFTTLNQKKKQACQMELSESQIKFIKYLIDKEYSLTFYIDKVPIGLGNLGKVSYKDPIKIGYISENGKYVLNNYFEFTLYTNTYLEEKYNFVGGYVIPRSTKHINEAFAVELSDNGPMVVDLYYSVFYHTSNIQYSSRWDSLIHSHEDVIHWRQILLSTVLILLAAIWVFIVFIRSVGQDIVNHNLQIVQGELYSTERNWKQLCYDVFRPPSNRTILCSLIGTGVQVSIFNYNNRLRL